MRLVSLLAFLSSSVALEFAPYKTSEQYKCGAFLRSRVDDRTLPLYYRTIQKVIDALSRPFPHQDLLNAQALRGDVDAWRESFETKYVEWLQWQQWWLVAAGGVLAFSIVFPVLYLFYRCCVCCCSRKEKPAMTDGQYDSCKRNTLNCFIAVLVLIDVFVAFALLVTGQYAEFGLEELPNRLNHCIDDLNLYKRDTDLKVRKLLIDDFQELNRTLLEQISTAGHSLVDRLKKATGAHAIDVFLSIHESAKEMEGVLGEARTEARELADEAARFQVEFARLKKTATDELVQCVQNEVDPLKALCHKAEKLLDGINGLHFSVDPSIIPEDADVGLQQILASNISELLSESNAQFIQVENELQKEINIKRNSAQNALKEIGDELFVTAETLSTQIRQVNFDPLYNVVNSFADPKNGLHRYVNYSWYASLVITSLYVLISLAFLLGLFYGLCGRRPNFYNDDCCVRSTGGKFISCGIWVSLFFFTILSIVAVCLMLVAANATHLVCTTLEDPLSRPDMLSLSERYMEMVRQEVADGSKNEIAVLLGKRTPAELIRACERNETFYTIFDIDKKYHLSDLKVYDNKSYEQLDAYLHSILTQLPVHSQVTRFVSKEELEKLEALANVNITQISAAALNQLKLEISELDVMAKTTAFQEEAKETAGGKPKAVTLVLEQLDEIDRSIAKPLRLRLEALLANLTVLDQRLSEMRVPVNSLLTKLQHAEALISNNFQAYLEKGAKEVIKQLKDTVDEYIDYVKNQMQTDVSSCAPVMEIGRNSRSALCSHTVDPMNGAWMSMIICLLLTVPIVLIGTSLVGLYNNIHPFPKYIVHEPHDQQMSAFITDTYDTRQKVFAREGYPYDDYQRPYGRT